MPSHIRRAGLFAAMFVLLIAGSAKAATLDVKVPFPFVVQEKTLPAGRYRVTEEGGVVEFRGEGNKASLYFLAVPAAGHDPVGNQPTLSFTHSENQYRLSDIWESGAYGLEPAKR